MSKKAISLFGFIIFFLICTYEKRIYYSINNHYVTVWKTFGGTCYIIPGKYFGLTKPNKNFISTNNEHGEFVFYWSNDLKNIVVFKSDSSYTINNDDSINLKIVNYYSDEKKYDDIFYIKDAKLNNEIKTTVNFIDFDVFDEYLIDKK